MPGIYVTGTADRTSRQPTVFRNEPLLVYFSQTLPNTQLVVVAERLSKSRGRY